MSASIHVDLLGEWLDERIHRLTIAKSKHSARFRSERVPFGPMEYRNWTGNIDSITLAHLLNKVLSFRLNSVGDEHANGDSDVNPMLWMSCMQGRKHSERRGLRRPHYDKVITRSSLFIRKVPFVVEIAAKFI